MATDVVENPFEVAERELTPEEQEQRGALCAQIEQEIKDSRTAVGAALWRLAKALYEFDQENGWTALGYDTQEAWLAQPEISMTRTEFFRLVRRYRELVINRELPVQSLTELEPSKLDIVLPAIEGNHVEVSTALDDTKALGARDLREKYTSNGASPGASGTRQPSGGAESPDVKSKELERVIHHGEVIDSWIDMGGDKRKAKRAWDRLLKEHPMFLKAAVISDCFSPSDGEQPPSKEEVREAWHAFWGLLKQWRE